MDITTIDSPVSVALAAPSGHPPATQREELILPIFESKPPEDPSLSNEAAKREPFQHLGNCLLSLILDVLFARERKDREASLAQQFEYSFERASVY